MHHFNAIFANFLWGMVSAYYYLVRSIDPLRMTSYRFLFTFILLLLFSILLRKNYSAQLLKLSLLPAILLALNAYIYLFAVLDGKVMEAVYGYLMAPILTVVLGRIILLERLSSNQWTGALVCLSTIVFYAVDTHTLPWFGFGIAVPFALYLIWHRHRNTRSSLEALRHESLLMLTLPISLFVYSGKELKILMLFEPDSAIGIIIAASGLVTVVPLALYVSSCAKLSIFYLGLYQFIAPIVSMIVAIFLSGETLSTSKAVIIVGLLIGLAIATFPIKNR